ncbi:MAG: hypothetical protein AAFW60_01650 [Pseudomonadota bacterium]
MTIIRAAVATMKEAVALLFVGQTLSDGNSAASTTTFTIAADGTWSASNSQTGAIASGSWINQVDKAGDCAVTATYVSDDPALGTPPRYTGTFGSSLALTSDRSWTVSVFSDPDGPSNVVFDLDFTINGNPLGATQRVTLQAE